MGFQNLLSMTFLPGKVIGERISERMIAEWEELSTSKKGTA